MAEWRKASDLVGETIDNRYRIVRFLGQGGMGLVYEAQHLKLGGEVAIKVLNPVLAGRERECKRFLREARSAYRLKSEHVVRILDFGDGPTVYFAMEMLKGCDLSAHVAGGRSLPWPRAIDILIQVLEAIAEAHDAGIVHRDLKPSNIFLIEHEGRPDFVKVLDFGIAKVFGSSPETAGLTATHEVVGTVTYMSPEQAWGRDVDVRTDIYALGAVMFHLLTGAPPFQGLTAFEVVDQHLTAPVPALHGRVPDLPEALEVIVRKAMAKHPRDRFQTAAELAEALRAATRPSGLGIATVSATAGRRVWISVGLLILGLGVAGWFRRPRPEPAHSHLVAPVSSNARRTFPDSRRGVEPALEPLRLLPPPVDVRTRSPRRRSSRRRGLRGSARRVEPTSPAQKGAVAGGMSRGHSDERRLGGLARRVSTECAALDPGAEVGIEVEVTIKGEAFPDVRGANRAASRCVGDVVRGGRFEDGRSRVLWFSVVLGP